MTQMLSLSQGFRARCTLYMDGRLGFERVPAPPGRHHLGNRFLRVRRMDPGAQNARRVASL